jgi:hypothetical protein
MSEKRTLRGRAVRGSQHIEKDDVTPLGPTLAPKYTDDAAVQLTIQDYERGRTYIDQKQWALHWRECDVLYQSPRTYSTFEGSTVTRANIPKFTVATHVNSLVPGMKSGIFYESPPFLIRPRPGASQNTARAKTALYGTLLQNCNFEVNAELALESMTNFGTVICKAGWQTETRMRRVRKPKKAPLKENMPFTGPMTIHTKESDELESTDVEVTTEGMFFDVCDLGTVFVDPGWNKPNQLHKSKWLVHCTFPTFNDLDKLREQVELDENAKKVAGYDIPSEQELKDYFYSRPFSAGSASQVEQRLGDENWALSHAQNPEKVDTADFLERPIKMLERWDQTYVYSVLVVDGGDTGVLIRKDVHNLPFLPFFSGTFWNIPNSMYGLGVGRMSGASQRIDKGLTDAVLDILSFACNPQYLRDVGANIPTQQIRQRLGGILDAQAGQRGLKEAFALVEQPRVPGEVFPVLQDARSSAESTVGADQAFTQGNLPQRGTSTAARTATGAGGIISANAAKIQGPVGHFVNGILLPFIELMDFLVKDQMAPSKIEKILGDDLGAAFELDRDSFYEQSDQFDCLAGARLAAKKAMAAALPMMAQIFENAPIIQQLNATGYIVDVHELLLMFMEVSEWKNTRELIRKMTPEEEQKYQQNNPGLQKIQAQTATIQARHVAKSQEIDQKAEAEIARDTLAKANDQAASWDERKWDREEMAGSVFAPA